MAIDPVKKSKVDAILAGVPKPNGAPTKTEQLSSIANRIDRIDRSIARLQEQRDQMEDQLIAVNEAL